MMMMNSGLASAGGGVGGLGGESRLMGRKDY